MSKYTGLNCKVKVGQLDGAGVFRAIAGQRDATLNINFGEIDVTSKDSEGGWEEVMAGNRSWDISCGGAHVAKDVSTAMIDDILLQEKHTPSSGMLLAEMTMEHGEVYRGTVLVTSYSKSFPHADLVTYDLALRGTGPLAKVEGATPAAQQVAALGSQGVSPASANTGGEVKK